MVGGGGLVGGGGRRRDDVSDPWIVSSALPWVSPTHCMWGVRGVLVVVVVMVVFLLLIHKRRPQVLPQVKPTHFVLGVMGSGGFTADDGGFDGGSEGGRGGGVVCWLCGGEGWWLWMCSGVVGVVVVWW